MKMENWCNVLEPSGWVCIMHGMPASDSYMASLWSVWDMLLCEGEARGAPASFTPCCGVGVIWYTCCGLMGVGDIWVCTVVMGLVPWYMYRMCCGVQWDYHMLWCSFQEHFDDSSFSSGGSAESDRIKSGVIMEGMKGARSTIGVSLACTTYWVAHCSGN